VVNTWTYEVKFANVQILCTTIAQDVVHVTLHKYEIVSTGNCVLRKLIQKVGVCVERKHKLIKVQ
jgi:hypothetical protein